MSTHRSLNCNTRVNVLIEQDLIPETMQIKRSHSFENEGKSIKR